MHPRHTLADPRRIDLTCEPDFAIGNIQVQPLGCEVVAGGRRVRLEPLVMRVLIALARAEGRPMSRETLSQTCWGGVIVGEDSLSRCIQRLRRLVETEARGAFTIETIPTVGYRLTSPAATATSAKPLLAVLAFDNLSGGAEMSCFSDGLSEEILRTVARSASVRLIGRASSFQFKGVDKTAARVASALKTTHVLDGSVRRGRDTVRISAELVDCANQSTLWSDRFDREFSDVLALQDDVAKTVATALEATLVAFGQDGPDEPDVHGRHLPARRALAPVRHPHGQADQRGHGHEERTPWKRMPSSPSPAGLRAGRLRGAASISAPLRRWPYPDRPYRR